MFLNESGGLANTYHWFQTFPIWTDEAARGRCGPVRQSRDQIHPAFDAMVDSRQFVSSIDPMRLRVERECFGKQDR